jgi:Amt family ammonium transporter
VFILWFGWYGFNAGSTLSGTDLSIAHVATTTTLAASTGAIGAMITSWLWFSKPDPSVSLNGALAGLVGITAGTWVVSPLGAVIIGFLAGIIVVLSVEFLDKVLHIDDPVGAVSVHGTCGAWGTIAVGLFADGVNDPGIVGLFYGGGAAQLGVQVIGVLAVFAYVVVASLILFGILKALGILRVSEKEELQGLDIGEHGVESYSGFQIFTSM